MRKAQPRGQIYIVITGSPDGGDGSDTGCADEDDIDQEKMPNEVAGDVNVFF